MAKTIYNKRVRQELDKVTITKDKDNLYSYLKYEDNLAEIGKEIMYLHDQIKKLSRSETIDSAYETNRLLIFEDDFSGMSLNLNNWNYLKRGDGSGNNQLEFNTDLPDNVRVENSCLVIEARKENYKGKTWTSGSINSNNLKEFQYGLIQAKMKLPKDQGFWPAFWMLGAGYNPQADTDGKAINNGQTWPECGEVDIMEHVNGEVKTTAAVHISGNADLSSSAYDSTGMGDIDVGAWHVYGVEWTSTSMIFSVDGTTIGTYSIAGAADGGYNAFQKPQFLMLNLAVGGSFPGAPGAGIVNGKLYVDWVRVYAPVGDSTIAKATSIALDKTILTIGVGARWADLNVTFTPAGTHDKTLRWTSSNENIATVGGGYVTGISPGTATITAITSNGKTASCTVTVGALPNTVLINDNFNRADNASSLGNAITGQTWRYYGDNGSSIWGISGNKAYSNDTKAYKAALIDPYYKNITITQVVTYNSLCGVEFRHKNSKNRMVAGLYSDGVHLWVYKDSGPPVAAESMLDTSLIPVAGQNYTIKVTINNDVIDIYVNNVKRITKVTTLLSDYTRCGPLITAGTTNDAIDSFNVVTV